MSSPQQDERFMRRALALARRGEGRVEPNPMVGCVLVRGGRIIGEGYHRRFGGPHAEIEALRSCRGSARGATAYVTLEPCCHFGKTPPCTKALIEARVGRVIAAMRDPFPRVCGKGARQLRAAGVPIAFGLLEPEARRLNAPYLKHQATGRPWVILKWAQSIDGKIATRTGDSRWISGPKSRRLSHALRARVDAVIVGVGTVLADDPELTARDVRPKRIAARIVLDPQLRTPPDARLVRTAGQIPTIVVSDRRAARSSAGAALATHGIEVFGMETTGAGLDLPAILDELGRRGMTNVLVEGGGRTLGAFLDAGLADEVVIFVAPLLIGGEKAPSALSAAGPERLAESHRLGSCRITRSGADLLYRARLT